MAVIWQKYYPDRGRGQIAVIASSLYLGQAKFDMKGNFWEIIRLDEQGNEVWTKEWRGDHSPALDNNQMWVNDLVAHENGCIAVGIAVRLNQSDPNNYGPVSVRFKENGEIDWIIRPDNRGRVNLVNLSSEGLELIGNIKLYYNSIQRYNVPTSIVSTDTPLQFTLNQNYPNPFNPSTTISFSVPQSGQVSLTIYDLLGRRVATLVNEELNAGNYNVKFDASQLSSGVYVYRLTAKNFVSSKKMILMK